MSKENVKNFMEEIKKDKELQEKIVSLSKSEKEISEEDIVALAEESGFNFTIDELKEVTEEKKAELMAEGELDDTALEQVAGGYECGPGFLATSLFTFGICYLIIGAISESKGDNSCTNW